MRDLIFPSIVLLLSLRITTCLFIDGCPLYGCRPSGSFSFSQNVPRTISVNWVSQFLLDPVPFAAGCVADSVSIVCLSNGPFAEDKGYISLNAGNGTIRWRDRILTYPTLPILDNYGDVTGTDGYSLVHYDMDGKKYPIIDVRGLAPVFNIELVGNVYLLMISEKGGLFVRDTNAIPVASYFLNATVQRTNGTFIPVAQPVVNGQRFYLLTEFVPNSETNDPRVLNLQRLYAIDIHTRMADIVTIAWYFNFEMENDNTRLPEMEEANQESVPATLKRLKENMRSKQVLLWDYSTDTVFVALPPPYRYRAESAEQMANTFWAFKDNGNDTQLRFRSTLDVTHMATFEADDCTDTDLASTLWVTTSDSKILSITPQGNITKEIDVNRLMKTSITITSKLSLVRENDTAPDTLIFGIKLLNTEKFDDARLRFIPRDTSNATYVIAINTVPEGGELIWTIPVPEGLEVKGQISGASGADVRQKDQLVLYADDGLKTSKIISLH